MKKKIFLLITGLLLAAPFLSNAQQSYRQDGNSSSYNNCSNGRYQVEQGVNELAQQARVKQQNRLADQNRVDRVSSDFGTIHQGTEIEVYFTIPVISSTEVINSRNSTIGIYKTAIPKKSGISNVTNCANQYCIKMNFNSAGKSGDINETVKVDTRYGTYFLTLLGKVEG